MLLKIIVTAMLAVTALSTSTPTTANDPLFGAGGCATHDEWNGLEPFMRPTTVADLFGTPGVFLGDNPDVFRRGYDVCWDVSKIGVVRYDQQSGYSISWTVRDR